jgi:ppGpp synthetase/RelA/SpoT-type nucleotidyltranferase
LKTQTSLRRKLEQKGEGYSDLSDVHDMLGVRVITFFPDEVDSVADVVQNEFAVDLENSVDKRALLDPDRFGYLSLHYVASLNEARANLTEHTRFSGRKFEIQIRSILQHAWAEIEHDLGYQTPGSIPDSVRRHFSRVAGLLETADDDFRQIRAEVEAYQATVGSEISQAPDDVPINRDSVVAFIASDPAVRELDMALAEIGNVPYGDPRDHMEILASSIAIELRALGLESIGSVSADLSQRIDLIKDFFRLWIETTRVDQVTPGFSLFYLAYVLMAESNSEEQIRDCLEAANVGGTNEREKLPERVIKTFQEITG